MSTWKSESQVLGRELEGFVEDVKLDLRLMEGGEYETDQTALQSLVWVGHKKPRTIFH